MKMNAKCKTSKAKCEIAKGLMIMMNGIANGFMNFDADANFARAILWIEDIYGC